MDKCEFVLSKLDAAIAGVRGFELISLATTGVLGLVSFFLALVAVLPISNLGYVRTLLLVLAALGIATLFWLLRRLERIRKIRLNLLRKWQIGVFLRRETVNSLEDEKIRRLIESIQFLEDTDASRTPHLDEIDRDFMGIIGGQSTNSTQKN